MTQPQTKNKIFLLMSGLATLGAVISIWQTRLFFNTRTGLGGMKSFCNIGQTFDCTAVEMSNYAELARGIPLSGLAIAGYLVITILALFGFSSELRKNIRTILLGFTGIALLFSLAYLAIMVAQIGKLCLLCLLIDGINVILFLLALSLPKNEPGKGTQWSHLAYTGIGSLVVAFLFLQGLNPQAGVKTEDLNDIQESVLASPVLNITLPADAPSIGDPQAPVTIVKFSDYECPACRMGANAIHPLFKRYPKLVRFVFLNFPLATECNPDPQLKQTIHRFACEAAKVALCAQDQGKFIEAYETLFENQSSFKTDGIAELLTSNVPGLDAEKLKTCMSAPATLEKIKRDSSLGSSLKIQSTPTFFVNGHRVEGGMPTNLWITIIEKLLKP